MNNTVLIGRLTAEPELRTTGTGKNTCTVTLAVPRFAIEKDKDSVDFIDVQLWNKLAENLCKYQSKGSQIAVEGTIRVDTYKDKEGKNRKNVYVLANNVEFLGRKPESNEVVEELPTSIKQEEITLDDDDLPF